MTGRPTRRLLVRAVQETSTIHIPRVDGNAFCFEIEEGVLFKFGRRYSHFYTRIIKGGWHAKMWTSC